MAEVNEQLKNVDAKFVADAKLRFHKRELQSILFGGLASYGVYQWVFAKFHSKPLIKNGFPLAMTLSAYWLATYNSRWYYNKLLTRYELKYGMIGADIYVE
eukprot:CAMPEP_0114991552 /NCGR_PEP_ID=MMETSP0216-20121206/11435_1 /TAXON_ID=223996 /ORGANISM="Protocruzia adherens, Strain Boccale" /LENGTH=100 /DNA_ID=CAMNT_0002354891 /DNA_START=25 /DNA_END=327 /DNA_ORIENTATION=-